MYLKSGYAASASIRKGWHTLKHCMNLLIFHYFNFSIISIMALMIEVNIEGAVASIKSMIDIIVPTLLNISGFQKLLT